MCLQNVQQSRQSLKVSLQSVNVDFYCEGSCPGKCYFFCNFVLVFALHTISHSRISIRPSPVLTITAGILSEFPSVSRVFHTIIFLPLWKVNAPGKGFATARTRLWISRADFDQSMSPSAGVLRPNFVACDSSCGVPSAFHARMSPKQRSSKRPAAGIIFMKTSCAVSSVPIVTAS